MRASTAEQRRLRADSIRSEKRRRSVPRAWATSRASLSACHAVAASALALRSNSFNCSIWSRAAWCSCSKPSTIGAARCTSPTRSRSCCRCRSSRSSLSIRVCRKVAAMVSFSVCSSLARRAQAADSRSRRLSWSPSSSASRRLSCKMESRSPLRPKNDLRKFLASCTRLRSPVAPAEPVPAPLRHGSGPAELSEATSRLRRMESPRPAWANRPGLRDAELPMSSAESQELPKYPGLIGFPTLARHHSS
mmetsp:Transcript_21714/g.46481  ORF Transcript_21714/g.46481 Transcript_21714/m.46481 type:complete len:249 (-) Transcript_21714:5-751(-)